VRIGSEAELFLFLLLLDSSKLMLRSTFLTVGLLISGSGTRTTELLRLASSRVSDNQRSVISDEEVLELLLGGLIDELLIVSEETLGNSLTDGINLRGVTSASDSDSHVNLVEVLLAEEKDRLEGLDSQGWRVEELKWDTVDSDHTDTGLDERDSDGVSLSTEGLNRLNLSGHRTRREGISDFWMTRSNSKILGLGPCYHVSRDH
jgi:hypothetical protein